jgi:hypothetical protein
MDQLMSQAAKLNLNIEQGASFARTLTVKVDTTPFDITNYSFRGQIRKKWYDTQAEKSFDFSVVDAPQGKITMMLSAEDTMQLQNVNSVYDVEMVSEDGTVTRLLNGTVFVSPNVTR